MKKERMIQIFVDGVDKVGFVTKASDKVIESIPLLVREEQMYYDGFDLIDTTEDGFNIWYDKDLDKYAITKKGDSKWVISLDTKITKKNGTTA